MTSCRSPQDWLPLRQAISRRRDRKHGLEVMEACGYRPLDWQRRFHLAHGAEGVTTNKLAICGLGSGKSEAGVREAMLMAIMNPGARGLIVAPTYDQLQETAIARWAQFMDEAAAAGFPISRRYKKTMMIDELWCGGRVLFRSANKIQNVRGMEFAWAWIDESEILVNARDVWDTVSGRIRQNAPNRECFATSTPRGLRGTVALFAAARERLVYEQAQPEALREWFTARATSMDNPHLPPGYVDSLRKQYSKRRWDEEILAQVLKPATAVFSEFSIGRHTRPWRYDPTLPYDLSYDAGDQYPHVLWIQRLPNGSTVVFDEYCEDGAPVGKLHEEIVQRCAALRRAPANAVADRAVKAEIQWLTHTFQSTQVHRMRTRQEQDVHAGVELLRDRLDPIDGEPRFFIAEHLTRSPPRRGIVRCFQNYSHKMQGNGAIGNDFHKDNIHDHGIDCARMHAVALFAPWSTAAVQMTARYAPAR